jgi:hypothetical protein
MDTWARLLERSFGGEDVAAAPGDAGDKFWPSATPAANADFLCDRLVETAKNTSEDGAREWVFLVGSAGNGKSALAKQVAEKIGGTLEGSSTGLAKRTYDYRLTNGQLFKIVNDATIPPELSNPTRQKNFLTGDINAAVANKACMLVCVNRGILLKERLAIQQVVSQGDTGALDLSAELVGWILGDGGGVAKILKPLNSAKCAFYKFASFGGGDGTPYRVHIVYLDQVSLFEAAVDHGVLGRNPWTSGEGALDPGSYSVATYPELEGHARLKSPAFALAAQLHALLQSPPGLTGVPSPLDANLAFLGSTKCRVGWSNVLRGAELCSGNLLTYREIWGLLVLGLIGHNRAEFRSIDLGGHPTGPLGWYRQKLAAATGSGGLEQLHSLVELATTRVHMALFGYDIPSHRAYQALGRSAPTQFPTLRILFAVDPVRDARPERSSQGNVNEAMRAITLDEKPSAHLIANNPGHAFCEAWQPFDDYLEDKVLERVHELGIDGESRALQAWLGRYLYRLYGLSSGIPAFVDVLSKMEESWKRASGNHALAADLTEGLGALVSGVTRAAGMQAGGSMTLPLLSPKAEPIAHSPEKALLALRIPTQLRFVPRIDGDKVLVDVSNNNIGVTTLVLDFDLCREALISQGFGGFTERSHLAVPRVERVRAALLSKKVLDEMSAIPGMSPEPVAIKGDIVIPLI